MIVAGHHIIGIDMAPVNTGAVSLSELGVQEQAFKAVDKSVLDGPARNFELADQFSAWWDTLVPERRLATFTLFVFEDTRFGRATFASSGEIRGIMYERLRSGTIECDLALLVSPSRWRSFFGVSGATGSSKLAAYAAAAMGLGFTSKATTARGRQDCTAAFLLATFGEALLLNDHLRVRAGFTTSQCRMLDAVLADSNLRIHP